jgi:hypothetical protein
MYSTDGINWIDATIPYGDLNCVSAAWSPSLSLFVMVSRSSSDSVLVSSDGQTWTTNGVTSSVLSYQWNAVVWADFCGKFTALGSQNGKSMYSSDGLDWNINGTTDDRWDDITVSNEQKIILAISQTNFLGSIDGVYWVQLQSPYPAYNGIWSSQLGLFVTSFGFNNNIYYSNDAVTWNSTFIPGNIQSLTWSPELGIMIGNDTGSILSPEASNIWYSYDGVSWALGTWSNDQPNTEGFNITWSPELGIFSGVAYSSDGINWTSGSVGTTSDSSFTSWSPELGLFVLLCVDGPITTYYYSTDGITWIMTQTDLIYPQTPIAYSPTLRRFVYYGYFGGFLVGYSDDGMTWNKIPVSYDIYSINWNNELQIFISNIGTSLDGLTWSPYPTQNYLMESSGLWSPELKRFVCALGYSDAKRTF